MLTQNPSNKVVDMRKKSAYCHHLVNVISLSLSQSDHIKRLQLYLLKTNKLISFRSKSSPAPLASCASSR
jgi:hypothetical protein